MDVIVWLNSGGLKQCLLLMSWRHMEWKSGGCNRNYYQLSGLHLWGIWCQKPGLGFSRKKSIFPGHPEKSGRNLFLPVLSGQNWKKLDKTGKNYERGQKCWKNKLSYLITYKRLSWLWLQKNQLLLAYFFQFYPDKTGRNWMTIGKTLKDVRNAGKTYYLTKGYGY